MRGGVVQADKNGDGEIDYEEFRIMMQATDATLRSATRKVKAGIVITPKIEEVLQLQGGSQGGAAPGPGSPQEQ